MNLIKNMDLLFEDIEDEDMYPEKDVKSIVDARYIKHSGIVNNPDIAALPYPASLKKILDVSEIEIQGYDYDEIQSQARYKRIGGVLLMQQAYAPLGHIFDISQAVNNALLTSYMAREVRTSNWRGDAALVDRGVPANTYSIHTGFGRAQSFVVFGVSGCGKTVAVNMVRNMYPRGIHHVVGDYEYIQIPIIMVTALVGNMYELMVSIASAIDDIIGIGPIWRNKISKRNVGLAANVIKDAIRILHIGLIIIDESQFLKFDASNVSLENLIGIAEDTGCALGFIGNMDLIEKMNRYPRFVGRTMLNRIEISFKERGNQMLFHKAIEHFWKYQWTKEYTELTDEILQELIRDSMYNVALLKALLMRVQFQAISKYPKSGITAEYIHEISESKFATIRTLLLSDSTDAERNVLLLLQQNVNEIEDDAKILKAKALEKALQEKGKEEEPWDIQKHKEIITMLKYFEINESQAKRALTRLVKQDKNLPNMDSPFIVDAVRRLVSDSSSDAVFKDKRKRKRKELDEIGEAKIRELMSQELKQGVDV